MDDNYKNILREMFSIAVKSASPVNCLKKNLPESKPKGKIFVVGAGKAAASMAANLENIWGHDLSGIVITRYGHTAKTNKIEVVEAGHPLPDKAGLVATKKIGIIAEQLKKDDNIVCLFTGGGSALLIQPAIGISYSYKLNVTNALLQCGASIGEINIVRKHLSAIKGGFLAKKAFPANIFNFLISDVPGDNPSVIASGPTLPDESTFLDAQYVIDKYKIKISNKVIKRLSTSYEDTPKSGDKVFSNVYTKIIARPIDSLKETEKYAQSLGFKTYILGDSLEGEARELAKWHVKKLHEIISLDNSNKQSLIILSGGETTVTLSPKGKKTGRGGRNTEFLLALAIELNSMEGVYALACDTDGIDGSEKNAGAVIGPDTLSKAKQKKINPSRMLEENKSFDFFNSIEDLVFSGPTLTNVNDFRVILFT